MTTMRRYVFGFLAVCVALAAGIALGDGVLQGKPPVDNHVALSRANAALGSRLSDLRHQQAMGAAVTAAAVPSLVKGRLAASSVTLFVLPGVDDQTVTDVTTTLRQAGAVVTVSARLSPTLLDPDKKTYVDSVASNSLKGILDLGQLSGASTYERIGALIARAYTGHRDNLAADTEATKIDAQLQGAKLITLSGPLQRRGSLVVMLAPGDHGNNDLTFAVHQIEQDMLVELAARSDAVVVAGTPASAQSGGLLNQLRKASPADNLSTVDVIGSPAGRAIAVFALAAAADNNAGDYGIVSGRPVLPAGLAPADR